MKATWEANVYDNVPLMEYNQYEHNVTTLYLFQFLLLSDIR